MRGKAQPETARGRAPDRRRRDLRRGGFPDLEICKIGDTITRHTRVALSGGHTSCYTPCHSLACLLPSPSATMLRRVPVTSDGKVVDRLQESSRINKPFKPPTTLVQRNQPTRKRKRADYKEQQRQSDESGSEDDDAPKKKKKKLDKNGFPERPRDSNVVHFPVFKVKPFSEIARKFSIPEMRNKEGAVIPTVRSNVALGIRPLANLIPRPLHDPMEDHAIVLYDPTVDDRETDEERREREKEEAKEKAAQEAREKTVGMYNPHKSLKELLGGGKEKKKRNDKVAVVIDPRLSKVLRPHQVEGVKVCYLSTVPLSCLTRYSSFIGARQGWS